MSAEEECRACQIHHWTAPTWAQPSRNSRHSPNPRAYRGWLCWQECLGSKREVVRIWGFLWGMGSHGLWIHAVFIIAEARRRFCSGVSSMSDVEEGQEKVRFEWSCAYIQLDLQSQAYLDLLHLTYCASKMLRLFVCLFLWKARYSTSKKVMTLLLYLSVVVGNGTTISLR